MGNIDWQKQGFYTDYFLKDTNISENLQNYSSDFEGLLPKMITKKSSTNQEINYINGNGESKLCTVSDYIEYFLIIIEIENKKCHICSK